MEVDDPGTVQGQRSDISSRFRLLNGAHQYGHNKENKEEVKQMNKDSQDLLKAS